MRKVTKYTWDFYPQFKSVFPRDTFEQEAHNMNFTRRIDDSWSFRTANTKEFTHCYHTYPAMMIPQVARALIREYHPNDRCKLLFDPYMGSGTSLVEALLAGINAVGTDLNPLARLMSRVKTTHYDARQIADQYGEIITATLTYHPEQVINRNFDRISNYSFWYTEDALLRLSFLSQLIDNTGINADFFRIALSEVVREVSFTRNGEFKRYRMDESRIQNFHPDVFALFDAKVHRNLMGLQAFNHSHSIAQAHTYGFNTVTEIPADILAPESVDMVVTSPPYGDSHTTVAYGQFSRWANEWFNFEHASNLDNFLMGGKKKQIPVYITESIYEQLAAIQQADEKRFAEVASFLNDYWFSMQAVAHVVRKGGMCCYVVGNRNVKGIQIPLDYFTAETFTRLGFQHIETIVREIPNKRMPALTSPSNKPGENVGTMTNEYIVILQKQ